MLEEETLLELNVVSFKEAFLRTMAFQCESIPWIPKDSSTLVTNLEIPLLIANRRQDSLEGANLNFVPFIKSSLRVLEGRIEQSVVTIWPKDSFTKGE